MKFPSLTRARRRPLLAPRVVAALLVLVAIPRINHARAQDTPPPPTPTPTPTPPADPAGASANEAYRVLLDDHAGAGAWLRAVDAIVQPADGAFTPCRLTRVAPEGRIFYRRSVPCAARGEALRDRVTPSVTELLIRRFHEIFRDSASADADADANTSTIEGATAVANTVAAQNMEGCFLWSLAVWDGSHCLPELREAHRELATRVLRRPYASDDPPVIDLYEKRLELGDPAAPEDYAAFLEALQPDGANRNPNPQRQTAYLRPMWRHPDDPAIARVAERLFAGPGSPWVRLAVRLDSPGLVELMRTPLLGLPAFRRELARGLDDLSVVGKVTVDAHGWSTLAPGHGARRILGLDPLARPRARPWSTACATRTPGRCGGGTVSPKANLTGRPPAGTAASFCGGTGRFSAISPETGTPRNSPSVWRPRSWCRRGLRRGRRRRVPGHGQSLAGGRAAFAGVFGENPAPGAVVFGAGFRLRRVAGTAVAAGGPGGGTGRPNKEQHGVGRGAGANGVERGLARVFRGGAPGFLPVAGGFPSAVEAGGTVQRNDVLHRRADGRGKVGSLPLAARLSPL